VEDVDLSALVADLQRAEVCLFDCLVVELGLADCLDDEDSLNFAIKVRFLVLLFLLLRNGPIFDSFEFLLDFPPNGDNLTIFYDALGQFVQKLILALRFKLLIDLCVETVDLFLVEFRVVLLGYAIADDEEDAVGVFALEDVGEVAIDQIAEYLEGLFGFVGVEGVALDCDAVLEEPQRQRLSFSEFMHSVFRVDLSAHAFRLQTRIKFLNSPLQSVDIDLAGEPIVVISFLYGLLQLLVL
jgi:hypothetical protein